MNDHKIDFRTSGELKRFALAESKQAEITVGRYMNRLLLQAHFAATSKLPTPKKRSAHSSK